MLVHKQTELDGLNHSVAVWLLAVE